MLVFLVFYYFSLILLMSRAAERRLRARRSKSVVALYCLLYLG